MDFCDFRRHMLAVRDDARAVMCRVQNCCLRSESYQTSRGSRTRLVSTFWTDGPGDSFSPGDIVAHIAIVAAYTAQIVGDQIRHPFHEALSVSPDFSQLKTMDQAAYNQANLQQARNIRSTFGAFEELRVWACQRSQDVYTWASGLPNKRAEVPVAHPWLDMECSAASMLERRIVIHTASHLWQLLDRMRSAGEKNLPELRILGVARSAALVS